MFCGMGRTCDDGQRRRGLKCVMLSYRVSLAAVESRDEICCWLFD